MGFRHQAKTYLLRFDDPDLAGLEVRARSLSLGEMNNAEAFEDTSVLLAAFARAFVSWNLEDEDGGVLPCTVETLTAYPDATFIMDMVNAWVGAVTGVPDELGKGSDSGRPSLEESIPMETLSSSLAS